MLYFSTKLLTSSNTSELLRPNINLNGSLNGGLNNSFNKSSSDEQPWEFVLKDIQLNSASQGEVGIVIGLEIFPCVYFVHAVSCISMLYKQNLFLIRMPKILNVQNFEKCMEI